MSGSIGSARSPEYMPKKAKEEIKTIHWGIFGRVETVDFLGSYILRM